MTFTIVHVKWIDAALYPDWLTSYEEANLLPVDTVGFLLYEDDRVIKIAQSNCADVKFSAIQSIPKGNIVKLSKLSKRGKK